VLAGILFLALIVVVALIITIDVARTPTEGGIGQADRHGYDHDRLITGAPGATAVQAFPRESAGRDIPVPSDAGLSRRPDGVGPAAGGGQRTGAWSAAQHRGARGGPAGTDVGSRILLLVITPAVAAVAVTLCVVRIVTSLRGTSIHSQISSVHDGAVISVIVAAVVLIIVLALALWFTVRTARSVLRPLHRGRSGVPQAAGPRGPDAARRGESPGVPSDVDSFDETGDATRAFDQMRQEISRLTGNETALRGKLDAMFVNLSHRSQSLVERQLRLIENLAQGEHDEQRLAALLRLNRLATRMHRSSQNLLILAGHEPSADWNQPVTLVQLVRAALSETEDYERVSFEVQPDIAVRGPAVNDLVHLLVELIENATSFSAADMPVHITSRMLNTGGALIDITDRGIGMAAKEMAYANHQLENPPAMDIDVPKWIGLLVVARLAARHRIRVRLNQADFGGLTALVWLPDEILAQSSGADPGHPGAAMPLAATARPPDLASPRDAPQDAPGRPGSLAWAAAASQPGSRALPTRALPDATRQDGGVIVPPAQGVAQAPGLPIFDEVESRWSSPGPTAAGLPRRPAPANPAPGTAATPPPFAPDPSRAAAVRERFAGFRRSASEGRTAPGSTPNPGGQDDS
jgi:signal transduction histidine kinase